jgi:hypothetical protein
MDTQLVINTAELQAEIDALELILQPTPEAQDDTATRIKKRILQLRAVITLAEAYQILQVQSQEDYDELKKQDEQIEKLKERLRREKELSRRELRFKDNVERKFMMESMSDKLQRMTIVEYKDFLNRKTTKQELPEGFDFELAATTYCDEGSNNFHVYIIRDGIAWKIGLGDSNENRYTYTKTPCAIITDWFK